MKKLINFFTASVVMISLMMFSLDSQAQTQIKLDKSLEAKKVSQKKLERVPVKKSTQNSHSLDLDMNQKQTSTQPTKGKNKALSQEQARLLKSKKVTPIKKSQIAPNTKRKKHTPQSLQLKPNSSNN